MLDTAADADAPFEVSEPAKERPWWPIMVSRDGSYLVRAQPHTGAPPNRILMPWVNPGDSRLFVKNGHQWPVHGIIVFELDQLLSTLKLDHDEARYYEVVRSDFDPTGCVEVGGFDLEKYAKDLNESIMNGTQLPKSVVPKSVKALLAMADGLQAGSAQAVNAELDGDA